MTTLRDESVDPPDELPSESSNFWITIAMDNTSMNVTNAPSDLPFQLCSKMCCSVASICTVALFQIASSDLQCAFVFYTQISINGWKSFSMYACMQPFSYHQLCINDQENHENSTFTVTCPKCSKGKNYIDQTCWILNLHLNWHHNQGDNLRVYDTPEKKA